MAFSIGAFVAGGITYITSPINKLDLQLAVLETQVTNIKNNDLVHISAQQAETSETIENLRKDQLEQTKQLTEILVLLKQR